MSMKSIGRTAALLVLTSVCFCFQLTPKRGSLNGTVTEKGTKKPIAGARVEITLSSGMIRRSSPTGTDGVYIVDGMEIGDHVIASYKATGYAPDPSRRPVTISKLRTVEDASLFCDCLSAAYWDAWANGEKVAAAGQSQDPVSQAKLSNAWNILGSAGVSAEARAMAARSLVKVTPQTRRVSSIAAFADADPLALRHAEQDIRAGLKTGQRVPVQGVSPEVASEITAVEARRQYNDRNVSLYVAHLNAVVGHQTAISAVEIIRTHDAIGRID